MFSTLLLSVSPSQVPGPRSTLIHPSAWSEELFTMMEAIVLCALLASVNVPTGEQFSYLLSDHLKLSRDPSDAPWYSSALAGGRTRTGPQGALLASL